jgi:chromosome segregation ATPase
MNREKSNRGVSNMDVLKDIRGLLSVTQEREDVAAGEVEGDSGLEAEVARLEAQIRGYKELIQKQQEELSGVESEKEDFTVRLKVLNDVNDQLISPASGSVALGEETAQLEVRIAELSAALSQIESLLKLRIQELLKRMANLFSEAGQGEVAIEFRKSAHGLEVAENFAHFLRVFLEQ